MNRLAIPILLLAGTSVPFALRNTAAPTNTTNATSVAERIVINDNRKAGGTLKDGVLTLSLEARMGSWYPEGEKGKEYSVAAFAERGGPLQNPGPVIRVPVGTEVSVSVRNTLAEPLAMFGLAAVRGVQADTFPIAPGETREMRFKATAPGTYYYAGKLASTPQRVLGRRAADSQLNGVIVVDPVGATPRKDERLFVISWWINPDTTIRSLNSAGTTLVINGQSWPHTERLTALQGDSLYWRWVSVTAAPHPMHLHGFYFRVDSKGNGAVDSIFAPEQRRLAVTELLRAGQTMSIVWSPERPGNWIFHCHLSSHITPNAAVVDFNEVEAAPHVAHTGDPQMHAMSRLVLGIQVEPRGQARAIAQREPRPIRLLIRSKPNAYGDQPGYAYVLGNSAEAADPNVLPVPGPTLVLQKDEPVAITLVNRTHEPAAVHWHGIELESFPDGVPNWSGAGTQLLRPIPVGDSLTVRFTPPRAGTFMYHSHFNEHQQISSGLFGAIVVVDPGKRYDPTVDRVVILSDGEGKGRLDAATRTVPAPFINGRAQPEPIALRADVSNRLRIVNVRADITMAVELREGEAVAQWRPVAKDGADLPPAQSKSQPAFAVLGPGEIYDFEYTPRGAVERALVVAFVPQLRPPPIPPAVNFPPMKKVVLTTR